MKTFFLFLSLAISVSASPLWTHQNDSLVYGLIDWWTLNTTNSGNTFTDGGATPLISTNNSVGVTSGIAGGCGLFSGAQWVGLGSSSQLDFANTTFTVSAWFNTTNILPFNCIVANTLNAGGWSLSIANGSVDVDLKSSASFDIGQRTTVNTFTNGLWHHAIAIITTSTTVNANNTSIIYVDGVLQLTTTNQGSATYSAPSSRTNYIGRRNAGSFFSGLIDNVGIYNRALTDSECKSFGLP